MSRAATHPRDRRGAYRAGRILLTLALVATPAALAIFLLNQDHAFNSEWHSHARFHGAQLAWFGITMSAVGLWLLWRRALEPKTAALAAAAIIFLLWVGEYLAALLPGTGLAPEPENPNTVRVAGLEVYGNLLFAGLMIILGLAGYGLIRRGLRAGDATA